LVLVRLLLLAVQETMLVNQAAILYLVRLLLLAVVVVQLVAVVKVRQLQAAQAVAVLQRQGKLLAVLELQGKDLLVVLVATIAVLVAVAQPQ
jgi:hypothetical protein